MRNKTVVYGVMSERSGFIELSAFRGHAERKALKEGYKVVYSASIYSNACCIISTYNEQLKGWFTSKELEKALKAK